MNTITSHIQAACKHERTTTDPQSGERYCPDCHTHLGQDRRPRWLRNPEAFGKVLA